MLLYRTKKVSKNERKHGGILLTRITVFKPRWLLRLFHCRAKRHVEHWWSESGIVWHSYPSGRTACVLTRMELEELLRDSEVRRRFAST